MSSRIWRLVLCVAIGCVAGCSTQGEYIEPEAMEALQAEITTAQDLEKALGTPTVTVPRDDGKVMWVYEGVHTAPGATSYIPYLGLLIGQNAQRCTRLSVLVDRETGALSEWTYTNAEDTDYWARTDDHCEKRRPKQPKESGE